VKQFKTIEKLDTGILYALELASSVSVLFLAFGLIASMANVLTKGSVLSDSSFMQQVWAWTQCLAIDASVAGTIIRTFHYHTQGERVKMWLYVLLSVLLLFTAAIVSNIEATQQTLNITLDSAYTHVFVPIELLIWIRSVTIVLLIVAHALRHVQLTTPTATTQETKPAKLEVTPDLLEALREMLTQKQTTVIEEALETKQLPERAGETTSLDSVLQELDTSLPDVSLEEITAVVTAFINGTQRREMCKSLKWGAGKYTTIVKPVLDAYERSIANG
jgi:hypothetical protein